MKNAIVTTAVSGFFLVAGFCCTAFGAYHHMDEQDSPKFQQAYPAYAGTKLDDCALCHSGGEYEKKPGKFKSVGSCQWCHMTYGYDGSGDISETLNGYGEDYLSAGRSVSAFSSIESMDSDNDTYSNKDELQAIRYPGDPDDDPSKVPAPRIVYTLDELEAMDTHIQFMLMNTSRGGTDACDYYAQYTGVTLEHLLDVSGMRSKAEGITVFCADGWSQTFDLEPGGESYYVNGTYPEATYYYDAEADVANGGWVDYSSPGCQGREDGQIISNESGLRCMLAYKHDGAYLEPGQLTSENKLDGEGPYRVVPPQKTPGPPDQLSTAANQNVIWPYDEDEDETDHNAGGSPRTSTAIRVDPLPDGTTDFNWNEGGWDYVDNKQIVLYGLLRNGDIQGAITDNSTGQPVENAKISTDRGGYVAFTDEDGSYSLSGVVCGPDTATYTLTVSASGYSSASSQVTVLNKETIVADFSLKESDNATCPAELAAGSKIDLLSVYRQLRDRVLSESSAGRMYARLYYRVAPEIMAQALGSKELRADMLDVLESFSPAAASLAAGTGADVSRAQLAKLSVLIDALRQNASPLLKRVLDMLERDINRGAFESAFPVSIQR